MSTEKVITDASILKSIARTTLETVVGIGCTITGGILLGMAISTPELQETARNYTLTNYGILSTLTGFGLFSAAAFESVYRTINAHYKYQEAQNRAYDMQMNLELEKVDIPSE